MKTVLLVAPHMDDEVLGSGGTLCRHALSGDRVHVCIVAHRVYDRQFDSAANERERQAAYAAQNILGYGDLRFLGLPDERLDGFVQEILKPLEQAYREIAPDVVYTSFVGDNNQDHRAVFDAVRVIIRPCAQAKAVRLLAYETPSATEQSPPLSGAAFQPNFFVDISTTIDAKLHALTCYEQESRPFPHPRSPQAIRVLAQQRGVQSGQFSDAEAFMILRDFWA